jgi:Regulator of chromosome condensation (RCC1) repeat
MDNSPRFRLTLCSLFILVAGNACDNTNAPKAPSIKISPAATVHVGDTVDLQIIANGGSVQATENLADFKTVQMIGTNSVYGVGAGTGTVVATLSDSFGTELARDSVVVTVVPPPSSNRPAFTRIKAGSASCATSADGGVWCWGTRDAYRSYAPRCEDYAVHQLPRTCESVPARVLGIPQLTGISVGIYSTCGLVADGQAYCWGNSPGQPAASALTGGGIPFSSISVQRSIPLNNLNDSEIICGLTSARQIYCWVRGGMATSPALIASPVLFNSVDVGGVHSGPAGNYTACAVDVDGNGYCWGFGALGDGNAARSVEQATPVAVAGGLKFKQIVVGDYHTCALTLDGTPYCWQRNTSGETGTGPGAPLDPPLLVPTAVNTSLKFTTISAGNARTCAIATDLVAYCWGYDHGFTPDTPVPTQVPGAYHFTSISTGFYVTCGLTVEGPEVCWGANSLGFVGNGYLEGGRSTPTPLAGQRIFNN